MNRLLPILAFTCVAAKCGSEKGVPTPSEFRIDLAGDRDDVESHSTSMCVAPNGTIYVAWVDDRPQPDAAADLQLENVYVNRKLPGLPWNEGWLPQAARVNQFPDSKVWNPKVACTDTNVYVVWEDDRDGDVESHQVYFQASNNGENWNGEDLLLEEDVDGRTNSFNPEIEAVGPNVYVTWSDNTSGAFDILFARSTNSGVEWQDPIRVDSDEPAGGAWSAFPQLTVSEDGSRIFIAWEDFRNGQSGVTSGSDVYFARSVNSGLTFEVDKRLDVSDDPGLHNSFVPKIDSDGDNIYVVWHDDRAGDNNDAYMAYSGDGGITFNTDSRADGADPEGFSQSLYPEICVSGNTGHVAWHDNRDNQFFRIYYNNAVAGSWQGPEFRLDSWKQDGVRGSVPVVSGIAEPVRLGCNGSTVIAAWLDAQWDITDRNFNDIVYNFSEGAGDPASWNSEPLRLDSIGEGTAYKQDLQVALKDGEVKAAWTDGRNGSTDIFFQAVTTGSKAELIRIEAADEAE